MKVIFEPHLSNKSSDKIYRFLHLQLQGEGEFLIPFVEAEHFLIVGDIFCGDQRQMNFNHVADDG